MALVKFYRGTKAKYNVVNFADGIYFSLDTREIIVNGTPFGYYSGAHQEIQSVEYTAPNIIVINYTSGSSDTITLQYAQAGISQEASKGGLMTQELVYKLSKVSEAAQENVIEGVALDGVDITPVNKKVNIDTTPLKNAIAQNKVAAKDTSVEVIPGSGAGASVQPTKIGVKIAANGGLQLTDRGLRVDETALEKYVGDGKAIEVDTTATNGQKKVAFKLNSKAGNILSATADGAYASVRLKSLDVPSTETNVATRYGLVGIGPDGSEINVGDVTIDILKDKFLKGVELGTIPNGQPGAGDDALIFTFTVADGTDVIKYVNVSSFLREAEVGEGLMIGADKKFAIKIDNAANEKNTSDVAYLQLDAEGLKLVGLNAAITAAKAAAKTEVVAKSSGHVTVTVAEQTDGHSKVTVAESDIASAAALDAVTTRVGTLETDTTRLKADLAVLTAELEWHEAE